MDLDSGKLQNYLEEFLPQVTLPKGPREGNRPKQPWTVILTGSTGSLGSNILASLQDLPPSKVRKIYCFNRSEDARERQATALARRGSKPLDQNRVSFLQADYEDAAFGLGAETLKMLLDEVNLIINCAWPVNFLAPLDTFRPHIERVRDLCQFAYRSPHHPPVLFLSSLGIAYTADNFHVPEAVPREFSKISGGYSQSKYVAERMVQAYADSTGLPAAVLRLGQIAGPIRNSGVWPQREWFPTHLRASKHMGCLPASLGHHNAIDWVPVDVAAQVTVEIADYVQEFNSRDAGRFLVFNIVNPRPVPWSSLLDHFGDVAGVATGNQQWLSMLRKSAQEDPARTPGRKLLGFYEKVFEPGRLVFAVEKGNLLTASKTARELSPVNKDWLLRWLELWGFRQARKDELQQQARPQKSRLQLAQVYARTSAGGDSGIRAKL